MFMVGPTFFGGSGVFDEGLLTPGTPTPSAIAVSGTPAICKIDSTRGLVIYQRAGTFELAAVVVTVTAGVPSFGTPVVLSAGVRVPLSVRELNAGTGEYVAFGRSGTQLSAIVIVVSGTTITTPNAEALSAALTSPTRGYGEVLSTTQLGVIFEAQDAGIFKVHGVAMTVAAGVITFGTPAFSTMISMGGGGGRPVLGSGELIQFGTDSTGFYLAACGFTMSGTTCTPGTPYLPPVVGNRISYGSTFGTGSTIDVGGGAAGMLYQDLGTGNVASVRMQYSGGTATYSNSDTSKNILPASPYPPPPAANIQGYGQASPSGTYGTHFYTASGAVKMVAIGIFGNVNMGGAIVTLVASGATSARPGHVYLTPTQILYCYVVSGTFLLGAGTCGVG